MTPIEMPRLSDSMEEGIIAKWLVNDGDVVHPGDELVEIETDKASVAVESHHSGRLQVVVHEGEQCPVGTVIAIIEPVGIPSAAELTSPDGGPRVERPPAATTTTESPDQHCVVVDADATERSAHLQPIVGGTRATPLARRVAEARGIDLRAVAGTGPRGRITRDDVRRAAGLSADPVPHDAAPSTPSPAPPEHSPPPSTTSLAPGPITQELTRLQQVIARRMTEAKATVPHFQVQTEVTVDELLAFRQRMVAELGDRAPTLNDLIVKASALALREHPRANGSYINDGFVLHERVNVGVAVATTDALIVPTVFDADRISLGTIAAETRRLAASVRDGGITPAELSDGTFTVSNLGMFGMTAIFPVLNPPQAAILGVGASRTFVVLDEAGSLAQRSMVTLTLSCDHRILYGADAARFLQSIAGHLEHPVRLAL